VGFNFEQLDVYKKALDFSTVIYKVTSDFPTSEMYGIISQLRRAAVSICSNIAEGSGRYHSKAFTQFLRVARGSIYECVSLMEISLRQKYIKEDFHKDLVSQCTELAKMLNGLINSLSKN